MNNRHMDVLEAIWAFQQVHRLVPSLREISAMTGISSTSAVSYHLIKLEQAGMIRRAGNRSRGIVVVKKGTPSMPMLERARAFELSESGTKDTRNGRQVAHKPGSRRCDDVWRNSKQTQKQLEAAIERVVERAGASAGVDVLNDFRRPFQQTRSLRATKVG